jgi:hypothetical protein
VCHEKVEKEGYFTATDYSFRELAVVAILLFPAISALPEGALFLSLSWWKPQGDGIMDLGTGSNQAY